MATAKTKSTSAKAAPKADESGKALAALEAKVAGLEAALAAQSKAADAAHAKLAAECKACCDAVAAPASGGLSAEQSSRLDALWAFCRRLGMR